MNINDEGIEDMIKEADKNGDGNVDVEGFLSVMNSFQKIIFKSIIQFHHCNNKVYAMPG